MKYLFAFLKLFAIILLVSAFSVSCTVRENGFKQVSIDLDEVYNECISNQEFDEKGHQYIIPELSTDVSTAYKNKDGTITLYVYAMPIRYLDNNKLIDIDTRIINVTDEVFLKQGYVYSINKNDIRAYYPKNLKNSSVLVKNEKYSFELSCDCINDSYASYEDKKDFINNNRKMIVYDDFLNSADICFYPVSTGTNIEVIIREKPKYNIINFILNTNDNSLEVNVEDGGYITLRKNNEIVGIMQLPIISDSSNNKLISYKNKWHISRIDESNQYKLSLEVDEELLSEPLCEYPISVFSTMEIKRNNQPDSAIYSKKPILNSYLNHFSVIGNSPEYGNGRCFIRFKFTQDFQIKSENIVSAYYKTMNLSGDTYNEVEMLKVLEDWCSITGNWSKPIKTGKSISVSKASSKLNFDITNEVKEWCDDLTGQAEHNGLLLKNTTEISDNYDLILSNDSTLYNVRTEIIIKEK